MSRLLVFLSLSAVALPALGGCGEEELPSGVVAKVGDVEISEAQLDTWVKGFRALGGEGARPGDLRRQAMKLLIDAEWLRQEAERQQVDVSRADLDRLAPKPGNGRSLENTFAKTGLTAKDIRFRLLAELRRTRLIERVEREAASGVSEAEVASYRRLNVARLTAPEQRDLRVVVTRSRTDAEDALAELRSGRDWAAVARARSIDERTRAEGGKLPDLAQGRGDPALDDAAFAARTGALVGPVKTAAGWYVFEVKRVYPAQPPSQRQVRERLAAIRKQKALADLRARFHDDYRSITICADGLEIPECKGVPRAEPPEDG